MARFSPFVEQVLRENGWFPGRRLDNARFNFITETFRTRYEFELFDAAASILREFGDLRINQGGAEGLVEVKPGHRLPRMDFDFDPLHKHFTSLPEYAPYNYVYDYVWGQQLGHRVYPIGNIDPVRYTLRLLVDDLGRIYEVGDGSGYCPGNSIEEALELLITAVPKKEITKSPYHEEVDMGDWTYDIWRPKVEEEKQRRDKLRESNSN